MPPSNNHCTLHSLRRIRDAFDHSTSEERLADPAYRNRLRESVTLARRNLLWAPRRKILQKHMTERGEASQAEGDPGLADFVLLLSIRVAFLECPVSTT